MLAIAITSKCNIKDRLNWTFDFYDQDNTDFIDSSELKIILKSISKMRGGQKNEAEENAIDALTSEYLKLFDLDSDGKISRDEFVQVCLKNNAVREILVPEFS